MKLGELEAPGFYKGDCRELLRKLPEGSVQCCVTSPPFWGLRVYEGEQHVIWGAQDGCEHDWEENERLSTQGGPVGSTAQVAATKAGVQRGMVHESFCRRCGAWKGGYGNEPTYQMYVDHTIEILAEIWRVMRDDGVVFWNIGDSYVNDAKWGGATGGKHSKELHGDRGAVRARRTTGLPPKSLVLMPHRVALAVQEFGWTVRSDIIWAKGASFGAFIGNVMPESTEDRPTRSHEHVLMLTKGPQYYWDLDAVAEKASENSHPRGSGVNPKAKGSGQRSTHHQPKQNLSWSAAVSGLVETRRIRDVWTILTEPYKEAHFAAFPRQLPMTCIKAATPPRVCSSCGTPWRRVVEIEGKTAKELMKERGQTESAKAVEKPRGVEFKGAHKDMKRMRRTVAWKRGCDCFAPSRPPLVLDPFCGSGTTCLVADGLNRLWMGFDLGDYEGLQEDRLGPLAIMMSKERLG